MESFLVRAAQLILSLSILVFLHELGHFLFARLFNVRVDKFYMFFNPKISLIRAKKINGKWEVKFFAPNVPANEREKKNANGEAILDAKGNALVEQIPVEELPEGDWRKYPESTEWGIGWLPLGGYCKISGMADESMDVAQLASEPKPWEYRSRSVWQRLPIIIGGVLVNFVLAFVLFSAILYTWGEDYLPMKNATYGLAFSPTLQKAGLKNGDKIIKIDGVEVNDYADAVELIQLKEKRNLVVARDSQEVNITLPADLTKQLLANNETQAPAITVRFPFVIGEITNGSGAAKAGLQENDSIVALNGKPMFDFQEIGAELLKQKGKTVALSLVRKGTTINTKVEIDGNGKLGVAVKPFNLYFKTNHVDYTLLQSIPVGFSMGWNKLVSYVSNLKYIFTKEGSKQLGGFGTIGKLFPRVWDWEIFWSMTALLSLILAFMNILPIPMLDGGYVLFLLYEMITGRKPNDKFLEYAQTIGFFLLMGLLIYANGNDIFRSFFK